VRSLSMLLLLYPDVRQYFVAPKELQIGEDIVELLEKSGAEYEICEEFEPIVPEVDAIYMTRIQDEWDTAHESRLIDTSRYHFTAKHLKILKPDAVILHPLPRRKEIAVAVDSDPRAVYWRQVRNGMWVRAALMITVFDRGGEIDRYHEDLVS
jgi:aspartate carbamoyltransferase catalytic subunit